MVTKSKIYTTKQAAKNILDTIDAIYKTSGQWINSGTVRYSNINENKLPDNTYKLKILPGFELFFL